MRIVKDYARFVEIILKNPSADVIKKLLITDGMHYMSFSGIRPMQKNKITIGDLKGEF